MNSSNAKTSLVKNGKWKEFNRHAVLIAEGIYVNNLKHGLWKEYYDHTGSIMIEEHYRQGVHHGRYAAFHPNGQLWSEGQFNNGLREGCFRIYDEEGNNIRSLLFAKDIQIDDTEEHKRVHEESRKEGG